MAYTNYKNPYESIKDTQRTSSVTAKRPTTVKAKPVARKTSSAVTSTNPVAAKKKKSVVNYNPRPVKRTSGKKTPAEIARERVNAGLASGKTGFEDNQTQDYRDTGYFGGAKEGEQGYVDPRLKDLHQSAQKYGATQADVLTRQYGGGSEASKLAGSGQVKYNENLSEKLGYEVRRHTYGSGAPRVGDDVAGGVVVDLKELGLGFNTKTGVAEQPRPGSGYTIVAKRYQSGVNKEGKATYSYAPTISRQAYNRKLGSTVGGGVESEFGNSRTETSYRDREGNIQTTTLMPSYTKEGKSQREKIKDEKKATINMAREVNKFKREGKNLYDYLAGLKKEDDRDAAMKEWFGAEGYLENAKGGTYEKPDTTDPEFWANLNENSQTGELADAKRKTDKALADVEAAVQSEIARKVGLLGDIDDATRARLEAGIRERVSNDSRFVQQRDEINENYNEWKTQNKTQIGLTDYENFQELKAARAVSAEKAVEAVKLQEAKLKAEKQLSELYPDQDFTPEQIKAHAKAMVSEDPADIAQANTLARMEAEGSIKKGSELMDSMSAFETPNDAKKYWKDRLPAWNVTKQMEKYYTEKMGLTKEESISKMNVSDLIDYYMDPDAEISEDRQKALTDATTNQTRDALIAERVANAIRNGADESPALISQTALEFDAEQNNKRAIEAAKYANPKEVKTNIEKFKETSPGLYSVKKKQIERFITSTGEDISSIDELLEAIDGSKADTSSKTYKYGQPFMETDLVTGTLKMSDKMMMVAADMFTGEEAAEDNTTVTEVIGVRQRAQQLKTEGKEKEEVRKILQEEGLL